VVSIIVVNTADKHFHLVVSGSWLVRDLRFNVPTPALDQELLPFAIKHIQRPALPYDNGHLYTEFVALFSVVAVV